MTDPVVNAEDGRDRYRACEIACCRVHALYLLTWNRGFGDKVEAWVCKGHRDAFSEIVRTRGSQPGVVTLVGPYAPGTIGHA